MTTRIRYKADGSVLTSTKKIVCGLSVVDVKLYVDKLAFEVFNEHGDVVADGTSDTLTKLKKAAKDAVVQLGAVFHSELRPRNRLDLDSETEVLVTSEG